MNIFNEHARLKNRYVRGNQAPFTKAPFKEIMTRSHLRNKFLKSKTDAKRKEKQTKKSIFNNLATKKIVDNKRFWQPVKPLFSDENKG